MHKEILDKPDKMNKGIIITITNDIHILQLAGFHNLKRSTELINFQSSWNWQCITTSSLREKEVF